MWISWIEISTSRPVFRERSSSKLFDLGTLAADDDAGSRGVDDDLQTVGRTLDVDVRNSAAGETLFQIALELEVFGQETWRNVLGEPMRMPVLVVPDLNPYG